MASSHHHHHYHHHNHHLCGSVQTTGMYLDEKWKFSKKENSSLSSSSRSRSSSCSMSTKTTSSQRRCSFTRKCARLVKEQRARFYIMRRCVTMLICWRDYS